MAGTRETLKSTNNRRSSCLKRCHKALHLLRKCPMNQDRMCFSILTRSSVTSVWCLLFTDKFKQLPSFAMLMIELYIAFNCFWLKFWGCFLHSLGSNLCFSSVTCCWDLDCRKNSYIIEGGVCYLTVCEKAYPKKLAYQYLEDLQKEFEKVNREQIETVARPYAFIKFGKFP